VIPRVRPHDAAADAAAAAGRRAFLGRAHGQRLLRYDPHPGARWWPSRCDARQGRPCPSWWPLPSPRPVPRRIGGPVQGPAGQPLPAV